MARRYNLTVNAPIQLTEVLCHHLMNFVRFMGSKEHLTSTKSEFFPRLIPEDHGDPAQTALINANILASTSVRHRASVITYLTLCGNANGAKVTQETLTELRMIWTVPSPLGAQPGGTIIEGDDEDLATVYNKYFKPTGVPMSKFSDYFTRRTRASVANAPRMLKL